MVQFVEAIFFSSFSRIRHSLNYQERRQGRRISLLVQFDELKMDGHFSQRTLKFKRM